MSLSGVIVLHIIIFVMLFDKVIDELFIICSRGHGIVVDVVCSSLAILLYLKFVAHNLL